MIPIFFESGKKCSSRKGEKRGANQSGTGATVIWFALKWFLIKQKGVR
jgi:hypothetical protein